MGIRHAFDKVSVTTRSPFLKPALKVVVIRIGKIGNEYVAYGRFYSNEKCMLIGSINWGSWGVGRKLSIAQTEIFVLGKQQGIETVACPSAMQLYPLSHCCSHVNTRQSSF